MGCDQAAAGASAAGASLAAAPCALLASADAALLAVWRDIAPAAGKGGVTLLPGLLIARWLGPGCEPGREWFARLWASVRPFVAGRVAQTPRIWNT